MNANLSSPMGFWPEQGTVVPNRTGSKLVKEQREFERIVWHSIGKLPPAEQAKAKQSLASKEIPNKEILDLMRSIILTS
jgi:hypothetical protein